MNECTTAATLTLAILSSMKMKSCLPGDRRVVYPILRRIHSDGAVITQVEQLLLDKEADYMVKKAGKMRRSETGRGAGIVDERRTSRTAYLKNDRVIDCIGQRLATIAGMPVTHLEPPQVTSYSHKQEYKPHYDDNRFEGQPRRVKTIFVYLDADDELAAGLCGGATCFRS